jgi:acetyl esterase/lipase
MGHKIKALSVMVKAGVTVGHLFFTHDNPPSDKLLVILPGRGYTRDYPLFYSLRMLAVELGYDVLSTQYSFQADPHTVRFDAVGWDGLKEEIDQALKALPKREYTHICFAGKSLGTPLAMQLAQTYPAPDKRALLFTPIANAVQLAGEDMPTLAVIGTADSSYNADIIQADVRRDNVTWWVFDDLNHSLEHKNDWKASMAVMTEIMVVCEDFLRGNDP